MRGMNCRATPIALLSVLLAATLAHGEALDVDPKAGNNTFTAVFNAPLGERITAMSSAISCDATYDEKKQAFTGTCSVPLLSIDVDGNETKSEHFQQWATNNASKPKKCNFEATFTDVAVGPLVAEKDVPFTAEVPFKVCGRSRTDGGKETVKGTARLFPAGSYGPQKTIQIRATVEKFNRESYQIGPQHTSGWLARVQALATVVAAEGTIEMSLFATPK